jgi:hypothetical protein
LGRIILHLFQGLRLFITEQGWFTLFSGTTGDHNAALFALWFISVGNCLLPRLFSLFVYIQATLPRIAFHGLNQHPFLSVNRASLNRHLGVSPYRRKPGVYRRDGITFLEEPLDEAFDDAPGNTLPGIRVGLEVSTIF